MRVLTLSLISFLFTGIVATHDAQAQFRQGRDFRSLAERAPTPKKVKDTLSVLAAQEPTELCKAVSSKEDGRFPAVAMANGDALSFRVENESDVEVTVSLDVVDKAGQSQGILTLSIPALSTRRAGLQIWSDAQAGEKNSMRTSVRVHAAEADADLSVVVTQSQVSLGSKEKGDSFTMDCIADKCTLREGLSTVSDLSSNPPKDEPGSGTESGGGKPGDDDGDDEDDCPEGDEKCLPPGPGTGPHGPH